MTSPDRPTGERPPLTATLGTAVFTVVVPGTVVVLVPYLLTSWTLGPPLLGTALTRVVGGVAIALALPLFVGFLLRFVTEGHGTPAPIAPTRYLVAGGAFRHTRNPGYVAVLGLVAGQALLFGSGAVLAYAVLLAIGFHLFVVLYEEPTLRRDHGAAYDAYCREVPRWLPRLGSRRPGSAAMPPGNA